MTETSPRDIAAVDAAALDQTAVDILVNAINSAAGTLSGAALDAALDDIGWVDALDVAPRLAVSTLFEQQGRECTTSGALGRLLAYSLAIPLESVAGSGSGSGTVALLPRFGTAAAPATIDDETGSLVVRGLASSDLAAAEHVVVIDAAAGPAGTGSTGSPRWSAVPTESLDLRAVGGLDPALGLFEVDATVPTDSTSGGRVDGSWDDAVAICRLAVGHDLVGTMRTMLTFAREHALDRVQFDRPIAGFQAVRHRLAETLVAIEAADVALDGAWDDGSPMAAALAKAVCGESARTVRRHCQQVLAGIGFTSEHDLHRYVRRSIVLDGLFGDARTITAEIGAAVLARGELPRLLPL